MTEENQIAVSRFLLPFVVRSENRAEPVTKEMEKAGVFCLAELERVKGGGLILKQSEERLAFASEMAYPLRLVPWRKLGLVFDCLELSSYTFTYDVLPDAKIFMENSERSSKTMEVYAEFLSDNANYFQTPMTAKTVRMSGLVTEPAFLAEFASYIRDVFQSETISGESVTLTSIIDESTISSVRRELESLRTGFRKEIDTLYESMKRLDKTTKSFVDAIHGEINEINEQFNRQIGEEQRAIKPKIDSLNEEYDEKISKLSKDSEKLLLPLRKEKVKLERANEQLLHRIEHYKTEAKVHAARKDVAAEQRWKQKANDGRKEVSEIQASTREVNGKISETEDNKSASSFALRDEREAKVKEVKKDLLELEASRDAQAQSKNQEAERLEKLSSAIIGQIDRMAKSRETNLSTLEKLGIANSQQENSLIYMPVYVLCYEADSKRRYAVVPPSAANSVTFITRLKGALGRPKVKQFLVPRFKAITSLLNTLPSMIERNAIFERDLIESSGESDMLRTDIGRDQIRNGLVQLKDEGWLSEKEYENFLQRLS